MTLDLDDLDPFLEQRGAPEQPDAPERPPLPLELPALPPPPPLAAMAPPPVTSAAAAAAMAPPGTPEQLASSAPLPLPAMQVTSAPIAPLAPLPPLATRSPPLLHLLDDLDDRPRERMWRAGAPALGDAELIALLLGAGVRDRPVLDVAAGLVREVGGVAPLSRSSPQELAQFAGVGPARAARLAAAFELGRRAVDLARNRRLLSSASDVFRLVAPRVSGVSQEVLFVIGVDIRNGLLDVVEVGRGSVAHVEVHPREVFRPLIRMAAAGGVLAHNHPTGDPTPSEHDVLLTRRLRDIGRMLGMPIIDHVVIGGRDFHSMAEWLGTDF